MRTEKRNVAVVFGGRSCENEISVITGSFRIWHDILIQEEE